MRVNYTVSFSESCWPIQFDRHVVAYKNPEKMIYIVRFITDFKRNRNLINDNSERIYFGSIRTYNESTNPHF